MTYAVPLPTRRRPAGRELAATAASETMLEAAKAAGKSEMLERLAADYPQGAARPAAVDVPGLRLACASGLRMRRTATILSGSACCVYGLTFTSHFYGARRTVGYVPFNSETLVTGQLFEDIRDAVLRDRASPTTTTPSSSSISACRPPPACRSTGCRRRSTACGSSASTCRASACRPMPRPRTCWPAPCCATRGSRPSRARCSARARRRPRSPGVTLIGELFPADPVGIGGAARAHGPGAWRRSCRRANGATSTPPSTASRPRPCIRSTRPPCASSTPPAGRSSAPARSASRAPRPGSRPSARRPASRAAQDRRRQGRGPAGDPGGARRPTRSRRRVTRLGLRGLGAAGGPAADRGRRRGPLCRHRLPAHRVERSRPRVARGARARTSSTAPRSSRTWRRCSTRSPTWRSAPRRWCRRPRSWASRRSTSPTWSPPGRCSGRPAPVPWPASSPPRPAAASASARMVEFFGGVGKGDAAGYGWTGVPADRSAAKARNRQGAACAVDLADAVGV